MTSTSEEKKPVTAPAVQKPVPKDEKKIEDKIKAKFGAASAVVRTGGKGSVRRKKKAFRKTTTQDDKRLQSTLKRLNVTNIPAIEEVNMFRDDNKVIHFANPKVQGSIAANTYVVSGEAEEKELKDMLPGVLNQIGASALNSFKPNPDAVPAEDASDDDVPELVESFEAASKRDDKKELKKEDKIELKKEDKIELKKEEKK